MNGFIPILLVGILINCLTGLFSRRHGLQLLPWLVLILSLYGLWLISGSAAILGDSLMLARRFPSGLSYLVVVVICGMAGALYWYSVRKLVNVVDGLTDGKTPPPVAWADPAPIVYGTPLSDQQLNATTTVAGSFQYNPDIGTRLPVGRQKLTCSFTPDDAVKYSAINKQVTLVVDPAPSPPPKSAENPSTNSSKADNPSPASSQPQPPPPQSGPPVVVIRPPCVVAGNLRERSHYIAIKILRDLWYGGVPTPVDEVFPGQSNRPTNQQPSPDDPRRAGWDKLMDQEFRQEGLDEVRHYLDEYARYDLEDARLKHDIDANPQIYNWMIIQNAGETLLKFEQQLCTGPRGL